MMSTTTRITVAEFDRMIEQGMFNDRPPDQRLELIHGELREMPPPNPDHCDSIDLLNYWSIDNTPRDRIRVRIQSAVGIPELDSVPLPDVFWMRVRNYRHRRPQGSDVLLLVEVAESSLSYDCGEKSDLYAAARIKDFWVVNLVDECIEVFRKPRAGKYTERRTYHLGEFISPLALPNVSLQVDYVFGH